MNKTYCTIGPDSDCWIVRVGDGSHAGDGDGYECLQCALHGSWWGNTTRDIYDHVLDHLDADHMVPMDALDDLWEECEAAISSKVRKDTNFKDLLERLTDSQVLFNHMVRSYEIIDALNRLVDEHNNFDDYSDLFYPDDDEFFSDFPQFKPKLVKK